MGSGFYTSVNLRGNNILYRGISKSGKRIHERVIYKPKLYVPSPIAVGGWKTLHGEHLTERKFQCIKDARKFAEMNQLQGGSDIYGNLRFQYAFISDLHPEHIDYDPSKIKVGYLDIEVDSTGEYPDPSTATHEITGITYYVDGTYYVFAKGHYGGDMTNKKYFNCRNETDLIEKFLDVWQDNYPDVLTGWFLAGFDVPYIVKRVENIMGEDYVNTLSPWGQIKSREVIDRGDKRLVYEIVGINIIDYIDIYKKPGMNPNYTQESYKLDYIAEVELGDKKVDYREMGYASIDEMYEKNFDLFIDYNVKDVELIVRIEEKMKLLELCMLLAYMNKVNIQDVLFQGRMWDAIIFNYLKGLKIAVPQPVQGEKNSQYEGAYVRDPIPGRYKHIVSFDFTSLYPHLMMFFNISPETIAPQSLGLKNTTVDGLLNQEMSLEVSKMLHEKNLCLAPNGELFHTNQQGFLPKIMKEMFEERKKYKSKMIATQKLYEKETDPDKRKKLKLDIGRFKSIQNAIKITLNSAYGSIGNEYFRYYDVRIAEAVTKGGQLAIRWTEKAVTKFMNDKLKTTNEEYVIGADTDSLYIDLDKAVSKIEPDKRVDWMDNFCEEHLQPAITKCCKELQKYVNGYEQALHMKRESLIEQAIYIAKKNYILTVWDQEGVRYAEPEMKIVGWRGKKMDIPKECRETLKDAVNVVLYQEEADLCKFIDAFREEFAQMTVKQISSPKAANNLKEFATKETIFRKGTPQHIKAALVFNWALKEFKLTAKYQKIKSGDKIRYTKLVLPNPVGQDVIGYLDLIPPEMGLEKYIDYDAQFEIGFIRPIKAITDRIGWSIEARGSTLDSFFS